MKLTIAGVEYTIKKFSLRYTMRRDRAMIEGVRTLGPDAVKAFQAEDQESREKAMAALESKDKMDVGLLMLDASVMADAEAISACVFVGDKRAFTTEEALDLDGELATELLAAIKEHNGKREAPDVVKNA